MDQVEYIKHNREEQNNMKQNCITPTAPMVVSGRKQWIVAPTAVAARMMVVAIVNQFDQRKQRERWGRMI